jgi:hypothetical protein
MSLISHEKNKLEFIHTDHVVVSRKKQARVLIFHKMVDHKKNPHGGALFTKQSDVVNRTQ